MLKVPHDRLIFQGMPPVLNVPSYHPQVLQSLGHEFYNLLISPKTPAGIYTANLVSLNNYNNPDYCDLFYLGLLFMRFYGADIKQAARSAFNTLAAAVVVREKELINLLEDKAVIAAKRNMDKFVDIIIRLNGFPQDLQFSRDFVETVVGYAASEKGIHLPVQQSMGYQQPMHPQYQQPIGYQQPMQQQYQSMQQQHHPTYPPQHQHYAQFQYQQPVYQQYQQPIQQHHQQAMGFHQPIHPQYQQPMQSQSKDFGNKVFTGANITNKQRMNIPVNKEQYTGQSQPVTPTVTNTVVQDKTPDTTVKEEKWLPGHSPTRKPLEMVYTKTVVKEKNGYKFWSVEVDEKAHRLFEEKFARNMEILMQNEPKEGSPKPIVTEASKSLKIRDFADMLPVSTDRKMYLKDSVIVEKFKTVQMTPIVLNKRKSKDNTVIDLFNQYESILDFFQDVKDNNILRNRYNETQIEQTIGTIVKRHVDACYHEMFEIDNVVSDLSRSGIEMLSREVPYDMVTHFKNWLEDLWSKIKAQVSKSIGDLPDWIVDIVDATENEISVLSIPKTYYILDMKTYGANIEEVVRDFFKDNYVRYVVDKNMNKKLYELLEELTSQDDGPVYLVDAVRNGIDLLVEKDIVSGNFILVYGE